MSKYQAPLHSFASYFLNQPKKLIDRKKTMCYRDLRTIGDQERAHCLSAFSAWSHDRCNPEADYASTRGTK